MPISDNAFNPENVLTLSLFLYDLDSKRLKVVKIENISVILVSRLIFFIFLRQSIVEHTKNNRIRIEIIVITVISWALSVYYIKLGVYILISL